jgi:hypothetical protein
MNWQKNKDTAIRWVSRGLQFAGEALNALFQPKMDAKFHWLAWVWVIALYALGIYLWGKFLNWGDIPVNFHDWAEINAARIAFVRDAILHGQIPLHMTEAAHLRNVTDRYWVLPDAILAPQLVFFAFLKTEQMIFANTLLLYTFASAGLLWFCRKHEVSLFGLAVVFLLFNFNGHNLAHFSVGHVTWWANFFFPWILLLLFSLPQSKHEWRWISALALLLFGMLLNGGSHQFAWILLFIAFLGLSDPKRLGLLFKASLFAGLLSAVRLLPPGLGLRDFGENHFLGGYATTGDLWTALTQVKLPLDIPTAYLLPGKQQLGWWEFDLYVGLAGALFLIYFGLVQWFKQSETFSKYSRYLLPTVALIFFSMGDFYELIRRIPFPLFAGERVSSRMMIVPFIVVLLMAAIGFQRWLGMNRQAVVTRLALLAGLGLILADLWAEISQWRVSVVSQIFPVTPVDLAIKVVGNHPDPVYTNVLLAGAAISLSAFVFLTVLSIREWRQS